MSDSVDAEIEAIRNVLAALQPLSENARASVLEYVTKRLSIATVPTTPPAPETPHLPVSQREEAHDPVQIKDFKEQKKPRSANEMAALVAYYLQTHAPAETRKSTVNQKDIETYFKIAKFRLPQTLKQTLPNARYAGYFDLAGDGEYKLNAVGHNLVVHSMPRGTAESKSKRSPRKKKPAKKKPIKNKATKPKKKT